MREQRLVRRTVMAFAGVALVTVAAVALAATGADDSGAASPAGTVRGFLVNAVVDDDGVDACRYLTPHATREVLAVEPAFTSCQAALSSARLTLGRDSVDQESAVKRLSYRVDQRGDLTRVTVGADGAARTFTLRRATAQEHDGPMTPATPWRVDSGAAALIDPATAGHR